VVYHLPHKLYINSSRASFGGDKAFLIYQYKIKMDSDLIIKKLIKIKTAISKLTKELEKIHELLKESSSIKVKEAILDFK
jgi:hypothetical protein